MEGKERERKGGRERKIRSEMVRVVRVGYSTELGLYHRR